MLFNSFSFLFVFLPITYLGALLLLRAGRSTQAVGVIVICSLFFYGYWRPSHLWVIVASLGFNYVIGNLFLENKNRLQRKIILFIGVLFNVSSSWAVRWPGHCWLVRCCAQSREFPKTTICKQSAKHRRSHNWMAPIVTIIGNRIVNKSASVGTCFDLRF